MKRILSLLLCCAMLLSVAGCGGNNGGSSAPAGSSTPAGDGGSTPAPAAGPSIYRKLYSSEVTTLNYLYTGTTLEFEPAANVIDTLVEYDKYGVVQPALATSWETSEDGLTWTFHLRNDAKWVKSDGTEYGPVTAHDFVTGLRWVVNPENQSKTSDVVCSVIANADELYAKQITDFEQLGVKAVDDYTLVYTLKAPTPYFLSMLTYVCFMPANADFIAEKGDKFGAADSADNLLYCGAFRIADFQPQVLHTFVKNDAYWDKDNVFLDEIQETFNKEAVTLAPTMYQRDEVDYAVIPADILPTWMNDSKLKEVVSPQRNSYYSYFFCFNFDPRFDAAYEPDNWLKAVNNENFRKSLYYALDRVKAKTVEEPYNPEGQLIGTVVPKSFVSVDGVDYTDLPALKGYTDDPTHGFDAAKAAEYKTKAMEELKSQNVTFPVKVLMSYNPSTANWDKQCQIIEQQMEGLLGSDYIDIVLEAGPSTNFLSEVRKAGKYALMLCNWGPDYADPETYTDPWSLGFTYSWPELATDPAYETGETYAAGTPGLDEKFVGAKVKTYNKLVDEAKAEKLDLSARYNKFAEAEAYFIDHAFIIPFAVKNDGYCVNKISPFDRPFAPFGVSSLKFKGARLLDKPMSLEEYQAAEEQWDKEREAALAAQ
ncbi:MAG: peptide ABC transporter substrate-binding protein [Angelakisella sp.]|jgi:oligopeptide transport system substrate-binding protein|nr:peptide ABC transporter substrate-binding protein [Angelakisella sp.]